ncbi:MAG TPA: GGDEF domain-containing protein [Stellaceae bacterium]|nr:GGDEF domain-containing protein [Stellaceae bacterium]
MGQVAEFPRVSKLSEVALKTMASHGVPPTPHNYTVWFTYVSGLEADLSREIDTRLAAHEPFTDQLLNELYERYCDVRRHLGMLQQTSAELDHAVERVVQVINAAAGDTASFNKALDAFSGELGDGITEDRVRSIVANLLVETQTVAEKGRTLEDRLSRASGEVAELRQNLEIVRREALTDPLTGIPNRKLFESRLREAARNAVESGEPLSLLMLDIDHFKRFNDSYGHQLGDQVLRLVAKTLADGVKGRDTPARFGGEEFVIVLPQTRLENAVTVAEQIRRTMVRHKVVRKDTGEEFGVITLSVGAGLYRPGEDLAELIRRADAALYHAKHTGRNRVVAEDDVPTEVFAEAEAAHARA